MVVVVTGGSQGVGRAIARLAASSGVVLAGRDQTDGDAVTAWLGVPAVFVGGDLADPEVPAMIAEAALDRFGRIDGLANAAGLTDRGSVVTGDVALWDRLYRHVLSMNAYCGMPELAVYAATKGALATLTRNAANAHLADRVRVNGIMTGWGASHAEEQKRAATLGKGESWAAQVAAGMPLRQLLSVDEVALLAVFLLSDTGGLMTGALVDMEQKVVGA